MRKTLFFAMVLCIGMALSAQNIPSVNKSLTGTMVKVEYKKAQDVANPFMNQEISMVSNKSMTALNETQIGETFYDLQSNASIANRFWVWEDGTKAAVWTRGMDAANFGDRGTGYNYFDGTNWGPMPTQRIQSIRCGWPNIAAWGAEGEVSVAHNGTSGLEWNWRETKGSGDWTQVNFTGPAGIEDDITWPRMITSGENNEFIHMFVNSYVEYAGQVTTLLYSRSDDGGQTWDPHNVILDGMGIDDYLELGADDYVLAARGNTVAMLQSSDWNDLFMMKSNDNGETWEKTVIWNHPYPFFDWDVTIADTFFSVCNAANIAIGPDGKAHVVFAINRVAHFEVGTTYTLWPLYDGIGYWNEDMPTFNDDIDNLNALAPPQYGYASSEMVEDVNYIGWMQDIDGDGVITLNDDIMYYQQHGPSVMPTIGINDFNEIYVIYTSTTETYEVDVYNYKHLFLRSFNNGAWGEFTHLTADIVHIFDECYYPVIGAVTTSSLDYIYNADISPGLAWSDDHAWQQNRIIHGNLDIYTGIGENTSGSSQLEFAINPNPATDRVLVRFELPESSSVRVTLNNIAGQLAKEVKRDLTAGQAKIGIDVSDLPAGTYICTIETNEAITTKKVIVQ